MTNILWAILGVVIARICIPPSNRRRRETREQYMARYGDQFFARLKAAEEDDL